MILVFFMFFTIIQDKMHDITLDQDRQALKELNNIFLSEVELARSVHADYYHNFSFPSGLASDYRIRLYDSFEVTSTFQDMEYVNFLPTNVTGEFNEASSTPWNLIYKVDGIVHLPNGTVVDIPDYEGVFLNVNPETCYVYNHTPSLGCGNLSPEMKGRCQSFTAWC
ncbi:MAG: hypothetical protein ACLFTH_00415 [Candidatus Woesearchaeota archaeon]